MSDNIKHSHPKTGPLPGPDDFGPVSLPHKPTPISAKEVAAATEELSFRRREDADEQPRRRRDDDSDEGTGDDGDSDEGSATGDGDSDERPTEDETPRKKGRRK